MAGDEPIDINERRIAKLLAENERLEKVVDDEFDELYFLDVEKLVEMIKVLVEQLVRLKQELNALRGDNMDNNETPTTKG